MEDLTTYTEIDPNSHLAVTTSKITASGLTQAESAYVYDDKGVNHFNGGFEHLSTINITGGTDFGIAFFHTLINDIGDAFTSMRTNNEDALCCFCQNWPSDPDFRIFLRERNSGTEYNDIVAGLSHSTNYYLTFKRDESIGTYGTLYLFIYTDVNRTNLIDTLSMALHEKKDFRYNYGMQSWDTSTAGSTISGFIENLDLQEAAVGVIQKIAGMFGVGKMGLR